MSDLEIIDAEIVVSDDEFEASVSRAVDGATTFCSEVMWQLETRAWEGRYSSLTEFWNARYAHLGVSIPRIERPQVVAALDSADMTQQQIAKMLNVSQGTVSNDLAKDVINIDNVPATRADTLGREQPRRKPRMPDNFEASVQFEGSRTRTPANVNTDTGEIVPSAAERQAAQDAIAREANAIENVAFMADTLGRLDLLDAPEYRARLIENNTAYPDTENPSYVEHFNPQGIRALADLLNTLATEMETAS